MVLEFTLILVFQLVVAGVFFTLAILCSTLFQLLVRCVRVIFRDFPFVENGKPVLTFIHLDTSTTNYQQKL